MIEFFFKKAYDSSSFQQNMDTSDHVLVPHAAFANFFYLALLPPIML